MPGTVAYRNGPCGHGTINFNTPGKISSYPNDRYHGYEPKESYAVNGVVDIEIVWVAPHGGWHSFRVCPNATMNEWYTTPGYQPSESQHTQMEFCLNTNKLKVIHNCNDLGSNNGWCFLDPCSGSSCNEATAPTRLQVQLPSNFQCPHCLLSWRWDAWMSGNEIYNMCSDIRVGMSNGRRPPAS